MHQDCQAWSCACADGRLHSNSKIQLMAVIGKEEIKHKKISIRDLLTNETKEYSLENSIDELKDLCSEPN